MEAKEVLGKLAVRVDATIKDILTKEHERVSKISPISTRLIENFNEQAYGGKRLRAAFVYYAYQMFGGTNEEEILKAGAAMELLHSYLLVHDDVMDNSDVRHRRPTIHNIYKNRAKDKFKNIKDAKHFGESVAICLGDILCHLGLEVMANTNFEDKYKVRALSKLHSAFADTGYGQVIDVFGEGMVDVDEAHIMLVHNFKTGKYTYENPLHVGAILAGIENGDLQTLSDYAIPAGIAFQIQDDILGMYGDEYRIGKPANSDLKEGKKTLLIIKAYENADEHQKKILDRTLGNKSIKTKDLEDVRKVIIDTGSLDYSKNKALELVTKAKESLMAKRKDTWGEEGYQFLIGIADYMINRDL